jgi:phosphoglycolate phosphatase
MTRKLVVFDVDGTILDSIGFFESVLERYSRENGLPKPCIQTIKNGYGAPHEHDFKWGVTMEEQLRHFEAACIYSDHLALSGEHPPRMFRGVEEAMRRLTDTGHTLALVTSKPEAPLKYFLNYHDIGGLFSGVRLREDIVRRGEKEKPAPDMLLSIMRELDFKPERTVMIGDTTMDMRMGRGAGAHTVGVTWGAHSPDMLIEAGAHRVVDTDFSGVVAVIEDIL